MSPPPEKPSLRRLACVCPPRWSRHPAPSKDNRKPAIPVGPTNDPAHSNMYSGEKPLLGICERLTDDDHITSTHSRAMAIAWQGPEFLTDVLRNCLGKERLLPRPKVGPMHIRGSSTNLGANAIVGGSMGIAPDSGPAAKLLGHGLE